MCGRDEVINDILDRVYDYEDDAKGMKYMKPEVLTKILHQLTSNLVENIQKSIQ